MKIRLLAIQLIIFSFLSVCYGQTRQEKTLAIIHKLQLAENQKTNYKYQLDPLKFEATGADSIKIIELENQLTDEEINKRISSAFDEIFSDVEINAIHEFIQSSAFEKFFNSGGTYKTITSKFKDIESQIKTLTKKLNDPVEDQIQHIFPKPIDKMDGFYATTEYNPEAPYEDFKLEDTPSLTPKDILVAKKDYNNYSKQPEIQIEFTKEGAKKFYLLTKQNIGKPIAIVIAKQIVSMPVVHSEIIGGKASISGYYSEEEIDKMIEILKHP